MFDFSLSTRIKFGCGSRRSIADILSREGWTRIGVVIDHNLLGLPMIIEFMDNLSRTSEKIVTATCAISEPTYDALEEMRGVFNQPSLHAILGLGGGSAMDMAKAMAVLFYNKGPAITYRGFNRMTEPVLPVVAIPTTAGTGSEVTPNASFIDTREMKKLGINGEAVRPQYAILDPELTLSCPKGPTLSAAIDSMVHATEAYVAKKTNPLARLFAREGFRRVFQNILKLKNDLGNINLRREVQFGAFLSGVALMHSGTGPAAAMSYPLSVHYQVPHGIAGGIFLPHVISFNINSECTDYADLYEIDNCSDTSKNEKSKVLDFSNAIFELWNLIEVPQTLTYCGLNRANVKSFIDETLELKGALEQNPVPFGRAEIEAIISKLM